MARRSKVQIRETYSKMLGEDLAAKLSDEQIAILSKYYNSLNAKETGEVDSKLIQGRNDTVLHEMARDMVDEEEEEEDIPEGLDDLLGSIQDEPAEETPEPKVTTVKASAIVPSKFFGEDKYAKYRDELVADGTIEGEQLTTEERKEGFKKRNDSDKFSRFVENFLNRKKQSDNEETKTLDGSGGALVVPKQPKINVDPVEEESKSNFDDVLKGIDSILEVIKKDQKFEEKQANKESKKGEREKRSARESKLEKKDNVLLKTAKKVLAPVKSIFDKIIEFFTTIFLGRALMKLLDWFGDKENGRKIDSIIRFLGDWWPAILGGFLLFGTGLGGLISSTAGLLTMFTPKILKLLKNPIVLGAGLFAAGALIPKMFPQTVEDDADKQANKAVDEKGKEQASADIRAQNENRGVLGSVSDFFTGAGQEREEQSQRIETGQEKRYGFFGEVKEPPKEMNGGGKVKGKTGIDKVPAMLTNGEFVMSTGAVQKYGLDTMMSMNAAGGGTNKPKVMQGTMYANEGGPVGFDPGEYRSGMQTTKHIENPGNTGKSYVVGYDRSPEGNVVVKQINKVVEKKLFGVFGSDKLTGVTPGSEEWNTVIGSANTQKELSVLKEVPTSSDGGYSEIGEMKMTPPKSITTHPQAKTFHDYNQKFQTTKNKAISEGKDTKEAEFEAAKEATKIPGINVATGGGTNGSGGVDNDPVSILMKAISGLAGFGSKDEKGGGDKLTADKESQSTPPGAKNPSAYPKQGKTLYLHWTAGGYNNVVGPYHTVFTGDGKKHRLVDYDRTSGHTYNRNSNSIGLSLASMGGGSNENNMAQAPTEAQLDAMATEAATIGKGMGWTSGDINIRNVMTHGEAGSNLDGRNAHENYGPSVWGGTGERWDLDKLRAGQKIGDGGPEMRSRIAAKLGTVSAPVKAQTGGQIELGKSKPVIPEITPLQKQKPKVTMIDGGTSNTSGAKRQVTATQIPYINASTASRAKANLLGIIDY